MSERAQWSRLLLFLMSRPLPRTTLLLAIPHLRTMSPRCAMSGFGLGPSSARGAWGSSIARDARYGRDVALKLMKGTVAGSARQRFEREFRSLPTLNHPHYLGVYDYGELGADQARARLALAGLTGMTVDSARVRWMRSQNK
jgi:hypothetical protein